jgi:O-acetyl-ADP-ribose deacetylase (regulator of RNase III)
MYTEINGDLIELALAGQFDIIAHQTNCFCIQGGGISRHFIKHFKTNDSLLHRHESRLTSGDIGKLGSISSSMHFLEDINQYLIVINIYSQYRPGPNTDYDALKLCLRKISHTYKGMKIGLPQIGCGIGGGDWDYVREIIKSELKGCDVTIVIYNK